jgi:vancomycin resistance protein YoaR
VAVSVTQDGPAPDASAADPEATVEVTRVVRPPRTPTTPARRSRRWWWLLAVPVVLVALFLAAWGIDTWLHRDQVARNTELAGRPVGGMSRAELDRAVARLARELPGTEVTIDTGEFTIDADAGSLGLGIDDEATTELVWATGRGGALLSRPVEWAESLFQPRRAEVRLRVDRTQLDPALQLLEGERRTAPVDPGIAADENGVTLVPGTPGRALDTESVRAALPEKLDDVSRPIRLEVERTVTPPRVTDGSVQALVDRANQVTSGTVTLRAGGQTFEIEGADFRPAYAVAIDEVEGTPTPRLTMDADAAAKLLADNAPPGAGNPTGVRFTIEGGVPQPVPGTDAQVCCGDGAPDAIVAALLEGRTEVDLPTRTVTAAEGVEWARGLGVTQVVGEFTTNHPAGQPRVTNIHRIADATRGVLIAPGDTFSINGFVGRRTAEKGYVSAPAIENGEYVQDIGGGVSQYATTLFNAAFFGGFDIPAYKPHSKYISRYPFGREATLAYPSVDLKIRNNSPYGVVIWPSYTPSSITVQLWSTRYATGAQTGQNRSSGCGRIVTERTRTFVDGRTDTDQFVANYDCE